MPQPNSHKVWFTGASKGFGHFWTEAALARGDSVAAAARNIGSLDALKVNYGDRLLPLALEVGNAAAVDAAVEQAHESSAHANDRHLLAKELSDS
jgi:NADP-dependent 3-hydroxy acid dehydrogenase YdfG